MRWYLYLIFQRACCSSGTEVDSAHGIVFEQKNFLKYWSKKTKETQTRNEV